MNQRTSARLAALIVAIVCSTATLSMTVAPSQAAENHSICAATSGASIPGDFPIDACFDGANVVLENHLAFPVRANTTPFVARPIRTVIGGINPLASQVIIDIDPNDPYLIPPENRLTIPVGTAGNTISVDLTRDNDAYLWTKFATTWVPGSSTANDIVDLVRALVDEFHSWRDCMNRNNWIGKIGCRAKFGLQASGSLALVGVKVISHLLDLVLSAADTIAYGNSATSGAVRFVQAHRSLTVSPHPGGGAPTAPKTPNQPQPAAQPPPSPQPTSQSVFGVMNTSETPPDGVWFRNSPHTGDTDRVTGHGVYANERVQLQCYAFGDAVGSYANRLWYYVANVSRSTNDGTPNVGYLNAHYINDRLSANQIDAGVPTC